MLQQATGFPPTPAKPCIGDSPEFLCQRYLLPGTRLKAAVTHRPRGTLLCTLSSHLSDSPGLDHAVTPDIHQAPPPKPKPVPPVRRTEDVFQEQNYNEGGLYQPATLDAMQDFLLTPLLREAVTYKLAHQVHNLRPENEYALGPLDVFPSDVTATADWHSLLFGGWWSWLEKWGKLASIVLGVYYLDVAGRWATTTLFSLKVLYDEHGFGPNLLWGLGPGQDVFPMRFYQRWRCF